MTSEEPLTTMDEPYELALVDLWRALRGRWKLLAGLCLAGFLLGFIWAQVPPTRYEATSIFLPQQDQGSRMPTDLRGLIGLGSQSGTSSEFYAQLLTTRTILEQVVDTSYTVPTEDGERTATIPELYDIERPSAERRINAAIGALRRDVIVETEPATGTVHLTVRAPWPGLAEQLNRRLLDLVHEFDQHRRQTQASAERRFLDQQLETARADLAQAEERLERFLRDNRQFARSPELTFEHDRLMREVTLRQQLVMEMMQGRQQARLDEVRNTPLITVVDEPWGTARTVGRAALLKALLGLVLFGAIGAVLILVRAFRRGEL